MKVWIKKDENVIFPNEIRVLIHGMNMIARLEGIIDNNSLVMSAKYKIPELRNTIAAIGKVFISSFDITDNFKYKVTMVSIWNGKYNQEIKNNNGTFETQIQPFLDTSSKYRDISRAISTISINDLRNMLGDTGANNLNHGKIRTIANRPSGTISMADCHYIYAGEARMAVQGISRNSCNCWVSGNWYGNQISIDVGDSQYCTVFIATNAHGTRTGACGDSGDINCMLAWPAEPGTPTYDTGRYIKIPRGAAGWRNVQSFDLAYLANEYQVQFNMEIHFSDNTFHMRQRVYFNAYFARHRDGPKAVARGISKVKVYRGG